MKMKIKMLNNTQVMSKELEGQISFFSHLMAEGMKNGIEKDFIQAECFYRITLGLTAQPNDLEIKMTEYCRLYIAEIDGDIAGYAFCAFSPDDKYSIKLSYLATKNKYRNKGVAKALIKNCIEDTNADYCLLHSNKKLLPFYEKIGFDKISKCTYTNEFNLVFSTTSKEHNTLIPKLTYFDPTFGPSIIADYNKIKMSHI
ncbi:hypothetical protein C9I87_03945 [Photobacterium iliopiscarium]|uniref:GNAT family N-acetyltransferase n=1 Tax=Photobacterium iliopiscarium TaxID=56192 RepID=UPI000D154A2A|nr:GNAT family N-acetyltransferase [Photobacterium iliopiscarium]PST96703.1 hypothetical protein C9I87_03945 [Photobacterium iliopiscarium]